MSTDRFHYETEAALGFARWLDEARKLREIYALAENPLPEPLKRALGLAAHEQSRSVAQRPSAQISSPYNTRPLGAGADWIRVTAKEASPTTLIPAVLRAAPDKLSAKEVLSAVTELAPRLISGSIYNAGTKLQALGVIHRSGGRSGKWELLKTERAALIEGGLLWGPATLFLKEELAAHRREAILHVLRHFEMGLEIVQIVEQLKNCSWVKAPVNKDLLKADVEILELHHKIRRRGNTRKWEIAPVEKGENKTE